MKYLIPLAIALFMQSNSLIGAEPPTSLKIEAQWSIVGDKTAFDAMGIKHLVADDESWKYLWKRLAPEQTLPEVDFKSHIVLLDQSDAADPNQRRYNVMLKEGVVTMMAAVTRKGFAPSNKAQLTMLQVPREGIESVGVFDSQTRKPMQWPVDSARVVIELTIPAEIEDLNDRPLKVWLFGYDPRLADVSATKIDADENLTVSHRQSEETKMTIVLGEEAKVVPTNHYYVMLYVHDDKGRSHSFSHSSYGPIPHVLTDGNPRILELKLRKIP